MPKTKLKLYFDTSVISAFDDPRVPDRQAQTKEFWRTLKNFKVFISDLTLNEIRHTPDIKKQKRLFFLAKKFSLLPITEKANSLAQQYIKKGIIPKKYFEDALHLAITVTAKINILVSWNCKHLVNLKTKLEANKVNIKQGYKEIELVQPPMVKI